MLGSSMGIVSKNLGQAWDRICKLSGKRIPNTLAEGFCPIVVASHGRQEGAVVVDTLRSDGQVSIAGHDVPIPRLIKQLQRHAHRSWPYLAGLSASLIEAEPQVLERLKAVAVGQRSLASCVHTLHSPEGRTDARWVCHAALDVAQIERMLDCFPDAKVVCVYRNGLDALAAELPAASQASLLEPGKKWVESCVALKAITDRFPDSVYTLQYEALVADPDAELAKLFEFVGLQLSGDMSDVVGRSVEGHDQAGCGIGNGLSFLSKSYLSDLSLAFSRELTRLGYDDLPIDGPRFHSQYGQDRYIAEQVFPGKTDGFFVDIGAHDGVTFSNSKHFEELGWTGVCVEPNPHVFQQLKENRSCDCVNACVSETSGELEFATVTSQSESDFTNMLSGIVDKYDKRHRRRFEAEVAAGGGKVETIRVSSLTFNECVQPGTQIDFVSIDTEGAELSVLQSIDFAAVDIKCFVIENNYKENTIAEFMASKGYGLDATIKVDQVFLRKSP